MSHLTRNILRGLDPKVSKTLSSLSSWFRTPRTSQNLVRNEDKNQLGGLHPVALGDTFNNSQYKILRKLGQGQYSTVWLARDSLSEKHVAIKILRADCYGGTHDIFELEMLQKISEPTSQVHQGSAHVPRLLNYFQHRGPNGNHVCLVLDVLGHHLGHEAQRYNQRRIPVRIMKEVVRQLLLGLDFLHRECGIVHTDLKPSNILIELENSEETIVQYLEKTSSDVALKNQESTPPSISEVITPRRLIERVNFKIYIIDLGVSSWVEKHLSNNIQPQLLRAPEVTLGAPWGPPVDIFSLGCLLIEMLKGHKSFPGKVAQSGKWTADDDRLAQLIEVFGPFPKTLLSRGSKTDQFFDSHGTLRRIGQSELKPISLRGLMDGKYPTTQRPSDMSDQDLELFLDFLEGTLRLDPDTRMTALELQTHPWLQPTNAAKDSHETGSN